MGLKVAPGFFARPTGESGTVLRVVFPQHWVVSEFSFYLKNTENRI